MNRGVSMLGGLGLGAGLMYLFDTETGRRRRALVRDRMVGALNEAEEAVGKTARDIGNRLAGAVARAKEAVVPSVAGGGEVLVARVRATLGRFVSHPHAITVTAEDGRIVLSGPILAGERADAVTAVRTVKGVTAVDDQLDGHPEAANIPGLQGEGRRVPRLATLLPGTRTPAGRTLSAVFGGLMAVGGLRRKGLIGSLIGAGGAALLYRALSGRHLGEIIGRDAAHRGIEFHKTVTVHAPVSQVYDLWCNPENFPRFMAHLKEVHRVDGRRHRWIARGPAGVAAVWESEIVRTEPNAAVAWRSVPGSMVENEGIVQFESLPDGSTRVDVRLCYHPPAGAIGHAVAAVFGTDPKTAMDEDLLRLKSLLEIGCTSAAGHRVSLEEVAAGRVPPQAGGPQPA